MGVQTLGDWNLGALLLSPNASLEWSRRRCSKVWIMSIICGSAEAFFAGILPVAVTAPPPPVRRAPRSFATGRRIRRKTTSKIVGDAGEEEGFSEWFGGEIDGVGFGFGGGDYSGRGWSYGRGGGWGKDDWGRGEEGCDWGLNFVYQVACWFSLSHCLYFALKKALRVIQNGVNHSSSGETSAPFASCSSVIKKNLVIAPLVLENVLKPESISI